MKSPLDDCLNWSKTVRKFVVVDFIVKLKQLIRLKAYVRVVVNS